MDNVRPKSNLLLLALPFVAMLALAVALYLPTFYWWWFEWTYPGSYYAHAVFVPFFVMIMIWRNRTALSLVRGVSSWSGLALLIPGLILLTLAERSGVVVIQSISFIFTLLGVTLMLLGTARTRLLLFPLLFVIMMMPLVPDQLINAIAFPIQITSARTATMLLNLLTLHSKCEGTQIQMEHYQMAVELPCSGFKTLVSLLTFSAAFGYLVEAPLWKRWTLFITTAPLSLIINSLRIAFIGIVGELVSTPAAATFHNYSGFIVLIMAFTFLFNFARVLRCERFLGIPLNEQEEKRDEERRKQTQKGTQAESRQPEWWQELLAWRPTEAQMKARLPYVLAIDLLLAAALILHPMLVKKVAPHPPIATFQVPQSFTVNSVTYSVPPNIEIDRLTKEEQEAINPTRIINRDYDGSDGSRIQFFLTAGNGRKVFHDPHTCSIGSDAVLTDVGTVDIPTAHGAIRVLESRWKHANQPAEFETMFCYFVEGKNVQSTTQVRNKMISQMLFGDSGQPSYFFRCYQEVPGRDEAKRRQLMNFVAGMYDQIGDVLIGKTPASRTLHPLHPQDQAGESPQTE